MTTTTTAVQSATQPMVTLPGATLTRKQSDAIRQLLSPDGTCSAALAVEEAADFISEIMNLDPQFATCRTASIVGELLELKRIFKRLMKIVYEESDCVCH